MARRKRPRFRLEQVPAFDARRGYARRNGVGVSLSDAPRASADFWRDRAGQLVVRFSSRGYVFHLRATLASGGPVGESLLDEFTDWIGDVLVEWIVDGVDDVPEPSV